MFYLSQWFPGWVWFFITCELSVFVLFVGFLSQTRPKLLGSALASIAPTTVAPLFTQEYIRQQIGPLYDRLNEISVDGMDGWFPLTVAFFLISVIGLPFLIWQRWSERTTKFVFLYFAAIMMTAFLLGRNFFTEDLFPGLQCPKPLPRITSFFLVRALTVLIAMTIAAWPKSKNSRA